MVTAWEVGIQSGWGSWGGSLEHTLRVIPSKGQGAGALSHLLLTPVAVHRHSVLQWLETAFGQEDTGAGCWNG